MPIAMTQKWTNRLRHLPVYVVLWLFSWQVAQAANYTFPGALPSGCSGKAGVYTCDGGSLKYGDTVTIASPKPATITVNGDLSTDNARINSGGATSDLSLKVTGVLTLGYLTEINANVTAGSINDANGPVTFGGSITTDTGEIKLSYKTSVAGSINTTSGNISISQDNDIAGDVISKSGQVSIGYRVRVRGSISTSGVISLGQEARIDGSVTGSLGNVDVGYAGRVDGSVTTSSGTISLAQASEVKACVRSTDSAAITLGYQAKAGKVCCGSSCQTSCVVNNSTYSMPSKCATSSTSAVVPKSFNCVESGANAISGHVFSKLAATPFALDVVALKDSNNDGVADAVATTYASDVNRSVTVELVDGSGAASCAALPVLSPAVTQTLTFNKASQPTELGRKSTAAMSVSKAYANLRCRVTDASQTSAVVGCSTDNFAVRPQAFSVSSSANNTGTVKAGGSFSLTAATGTAGYNGTPKLDSSKVTPHAGATATGSVAGVFGAADSNSGTATGAGFSYSEVGLFSFLAQGVYDDSFTSVDSGAGDCTSDFSNSASVNGQYGCKFGNTATTTSFGRFIPDHFDASLNTPLFAPACTSFSYVGQPIKYATVPVVTVSAKNASGATTQNYTGSYWKISPSHASYGISPSYSEASQSLTVLNSSVPVAVDNGKGLSTLTFADTTSNILGITRGNPLAPFNAEIAMRFSVQDSDGVQVANVNGVAATNPVAFGAASAGNGIGFSSGYKTQRWGRLNISNAYGSELTALSVPLFSEYYNGSAFVTNAADNCTSLSLSSQIKLSNAATSSGALKAGNMAMTILPSGTSSATLANTPLVGGLAGLSFSAPGAGNTGYIDVSGSFSSLPWLLFDWDHDGAHDDSPAARVSFGLYKGNSQHIFLREVY